jgi:hypothetical protein
MEITILVNLHGISIGFMGFKWDLNGI